MNKITEYKKDRTAQSIDMKITIQIILIACGLLLPAVSLVAQDEHSGHDHSLHEEKENKEHEAHDHESGEAEENHDEDANEGHEDHQDEVTISARAVEIFKFSTEVVEKRTLSDVITVPARVSYNAEAMAHISSQVQGRIQEIFVRLGDKVDKGQLLLIVDSPELGAAKSEFLQQNVAVDASTAKVEVARDLIQVARKSFDRAEELQETGSLSMTEYLDREATLRQAEANLKLSEADLRVTESKRLAAENQLHIYGYRHEDCSALLEEGEVSTQYEIRAPIAGEIIQREVTPGEVVDPGQDSLMVIADMKELWVLGDVPESYLGGLRRGESARVILNAFGNSPFEGEVAYIAPQLDPKTRTAKVRIILQNIGSKDDEADGKDHSGHDGHEDHSHSGRHEEGTSEYEEPSVKLRPGMYGQAELTLGTSKAKKGVLVVQEKAVQSIEGMSVVFVPSKEESYTYIMRRIETGTRIGRWIPVISGLEEREEYVVSNSFILKAELEKEGAEHAHAH